MGESKGVKFEAVCPLLDTEAERVGAMQRGATDEVHAPDSDGVMEKVRLAKSAGRMVILVSMGTLVTGDDKDLGWNAQKMVDGSPVGLANHEVVRSAWAAVFESAGKSRDHVGPLIVVSLGPRRNALGDLEPPKNAICQQRVPQLDILKEGVDCFVMGGGQNGFQEGLSNGAPFVCIPVVSDQFVQAGLVDKKGFGKSVYRPEPAAEAKEEAITKFKEEIAAAVETVLTEGAFKEAVADVKVQFEAAHGVERVVEILEA